MKFRKVQESDAALINAWIALDDDHRGKFDASFFSEEPGGHESFVVTDDKDVPMMFVRAENVMRLHIQFSPSRTTNARAMVKFIPTIEAIAKSKKYVEIIFESVVEPLKKFAAKFGYKLSPNEVNKRL